ncbi:cytochrome P450 [Hypoxylon sp. NC1633]|nr:cytochrome P450 [Hypoxylon sp. NC1633]
MTKKELFFKRVTKALLESPVVECQLGPEKVYFVTGQVIVSTVLQCSSINLISEPWMLLILKNVAGYTDADLAKLAGDNSGIGKVPLPGGESILPANRIWYLKHKVHNDYLAAPRHTEALAASFQNFLAKKLSTFPIGEWAQVSVMNFIRREMAAASICSVVGRDILDKHPAFIDALGKYDSYAESLAFGLPSWLNKRGIKAREDLRTMCLEWYEEAEQGASMMPSQESDSVFGSRLSKELRDWAKSFGFSNESIASVYMFLFLGMNTNTIPICTWALMEIIADADLFQATRVEVLQALVTHPVSGDRTFDIQKLASLPLIQSIYTESLRLHLSLNLTRTATEDFTIGGFTLPKGCTIQAPTQVSHYEEAVWGTPTHRASEFWTYRHIKVRDKRPQPGDTGSGTLASSTTGRTGSFFPYGGGGYMCPGRNLAKQEVLLMIAMIVTKFDIDFIGWTKLDGSPSQRSAQNDSRYAGAGSVPPDREMRVRWKRLQ